MPNNLSSTESTFSYTIILPNRDVAHFTLRLLPIIFLPSTPFLHSLKRQISQPLFSLRHVSFTRSIILTSQSGTPFALKLSTSHYRSCLSLLPTLPNAPHIPCLLLSFLRLPICPPSPFFLATLHFSFPPALHLCVPPSLSAANGLR